MALLSVKHPRTGHQVAYRDRPQPIGHNATLSAPHMHAIMLELLHAHARPGARVLDVGSGSGYIAGANPKP